MKRKSITAKEVIHMPRHDQTGPLGDGPETGRGAGFCAGNPQRDDRRHQQAPGFGHGFGRLRGFRGGMGRGLRARRGGFFAQPTPQDDRSLLDNQREALRNRLDVINQRLEELSAQELQES